jgi:Polyketide cyclase / dehydrase and lipid transport
MAMRMVRAATVSEWIAAPPEVVWGLVADVTRGGEWSGESLGCEWLDGVHEATPGARFRGRNKRGLFGWQRISEVISVDRPRTLVWRTVPTFMYPDSTEWRLGLEEEAGGTRVTEEMRILRMYRPMEIGIYWFIPAHRDRTQDLAEDLQRLKLVAERQAIHTG